MAKASHFAINRNGARVACFKSQERATKWMARHDPEAYRVIAVAEYDKYISFDPYLDCDRDVRIEGRSVRIVRTRKAHTCLTASLKQHEIPVGSMARFESAIVDGQPGSYYTCLECLDYLIARVMQ